MSCSSQQLVPLARNQSLSSAADGAPKVYWSEPQRFASAAVYFRALILYANQAEVRVRGRCSIDGVTYVDANPDADGYIDGLSAAWDAAGFYSFQYLGSPDEHSDFFQLGIEVRGQTVGTVRSAGSVTLSASAAFGAAQAWTFDLGANAATLAQTNVPALIPGAQTVATAGFSRVRVALTFVAAPQQLVTLYLATGASQASLAVDQQTRVTAVSGDGLTLSFVVDAPDAWSTVYYSVPAVTTGTVAGLSVTLLP